MVFGYLGRVCRSIDKTETRRQMTDKIDITVCNEKYMNENRPHRGDKGLSTQ